MVIAFSNYQYFSFSPGPIMRVTEATLFISQRIIHIINNI